MSTPIKPVLPASIPQLCIPRSAFETCGFRSMTIACGEVVWEDGRTNSFSVRLVADQGTAGGIRVVVDDHHSLSERDSRSVRLCKRPAL